jgi:hypothetical protein
MKTLVLLFVVLVGLVALVAAGRGGRGRGRNRNNDEGCSEWALEECVPTRGDCGRGTQKGTRTGDTCELKEKTFRCKKPCQGARQDRGCKYNKQTAVRGECDSNNMMTITLTLKKGGSDCPATKTVTKACHQGRNRDTREARGRSRGAGAGCRYAKAEWSECDPATNVMTKTMTLKRGDAGTCEPTKVVTKKCNKEKCTYGQWSEWGECQNGSRTKTREVLSGGEECQSRTSKTKPCRN